MSKHRDNRCYQDEFGGYNLGAGSYGGECGSYYGGLGIKWVYAFLILIVIVLQFSRVNKNRVITSGQCCEDTVVTTTGADGFVDGQLIDNSVLFIIVVFLLILCSGCSTGRA